MHVFGAMPDVKPMLSKYFTIMYFHPTAFPILLISPSLIVIYQVRPLNTHPKTGTVGNHQCSLSMGPMPFAIGGL